MSPEDQQVEVEVEVVNELGLHLRAAARFVDVASGQPCSVHVRTDGPEVDGKSLLALSSLLARKGSVLRIRCQGPGADAAAHELQTLVASGFPGIRAG